LQHSADACLLADVADILPGTSIPGRIDDLPSGPVHLILPRHAGEDGQPIRYGSIPASDRVLVELERQPPAERWLRSGDILFMSRGMNNRACQLLDLPDGEPVATPIIFHVIRVKPDRILPSYLTWLLNQTSVQATIAQNIRTSSVSTPMVPREDFGKMPIPVPDLNRQRLLAELADLMLREQGLRRRLSALTDQAFQGLGARILGSLTSEGFIP